jgi:hypothetical protein
MHTAPFRPGLPRALVIALVAGAALLAAIAATAVAASAASAATLNLNRACYVFKGRTKPAVTVTGTGYGPGDSVAIESRSGFGVNLTANAAGDIAGRAEAPLPPLNAAKAKKFTVTAKDFTQSGSDSVVASASSHVTAFAASHGAGKHKAPGNRALAEKVKWAFTGFPVHRKIYGHYLHGSRLVAVQKFGRTKGPCGTLVTHKRGYPGNPHHSSYTVQLDTHKKYAKKTTPRLRLKVALSIF